VSASDPGSLVNLRGLTTFNTSIPVGGYLAAAGSLSATGGGSVALNSGLTSLSGVNVTVDATGTLPLDQLTSVTVCSLTVNGASDTLPNLTDIEGSNLDVQGGGSLSLPGVTTYDNNNSTYSNAFQTEDPNSKLSLPKLGTITGNSVNFSATAAGDTID